jgi:hypothetical protein
MRTIALFFALPLVGCSSASIAPADAGEDASIDAPADALANADAANEAANDAGDASSFDAISTKDAADSSLQCTNIAVPAHVTPVTSSAAPPTPAGGTIASGLYHLTAATWFGVTTAPGAFGMAWDVSSRTSPTPTTPKVTFAPRQRITRRAGVAATSRSRRSRARA